MRALFAIIGIIIWTSVSAQPGVKNLIKDSTFTIINLDSSLNCYYKLEAYSKWELDSENLYSLDSIISTILIQHEKSGTPFNCGFNLHDYQYFFQLIPIIDSRGNKMFWINAFNPEVAKFNKPYRPLRKDAVEYDWNTYIVCGNDGCGAFWEFKFNVESNAITDLFISGI
jgi:hypothetical protein